jgi:hypothetical protein
MKILITGHTSSIGSMLYEHLRKKHEVIGASRSTDYDLSTYQGVVKLLEASKESDYFINLANINSQADLLYSVYNIWSEAGKSGKIINFGTLATEVPYSLLKKIPVDMNMVARKLSLEKMHKELAYKQPFGNQPQSILIRFANYGQKPGHRDNEPFTRPDQMIKIIDFILESDTYISNIDFREI